MKKVKGTHFISVPMLEAGALAYLDANKANPPIHLSQAARRIYEAMEKARVENPQTPRIREPRAKPK